MALGVLNRLNDRKISVPEQMSVVGFDDIAMAGMCTPQLTTVEMPTEQGGRVAVDLLLDELAGGEGDQGAAQQRFVGTQLIVRASTAPPRT